MKTGAVCDTECRMFTQAMDRLVGEKICVVLLTYNHVEVIVSTLQSILDQTITGYEVIVSDDCSTDGTWERILELAATDARIQPIRTPCNMGMAGNANFAVARSGRVDVPLPRLRGVVVIENAAASPEARAPERLRPGPENIGVIHRRGGDEAASERLVVRRLQVVHIDAIVADQLNE